MDEFLMTFSWFAKYLIAGAIFSGIYASYKSNVEKYSLDDSDKLAWLLFWPLFLTEVFLASITNTAEKLANLYFKK